MSWVEDAAAAQLTLTTLAKQQGTLPSSRLFSTFPENRVLRVLQVGALQTQEELVDFLRSTLYEIFNLDCLQSYRYAYQEELALGLQAVLYWGSTWRRAQSIGDRLHNLVLFDERRAQLSGQEAVVHNVPSLAPSRALLLLHALLSVVLPYLLRKLQRRALEEEWESREPRSLRAWIAKGARVAMIVWAALSLLNTMHFLATARYRTLLERLLSLRLMYGSQKTQRLMNLVYLNQHVTWQTWASLFSVLNVGRYFSRLARSLRAFAAPSGSYGSNENICCACHNRPTIGQRSNCGHLYCYYCIKSRLLDPKQAGSFRCFRCGMMVVSAQPLSKILTLMDPAAGVFSPFYKVSTGASALLVHAMQELDAPHDEMEQCSDKAAVNGGAHAGVSRRGTPCCVCGVAFTKLSVPDGGVFLCAGCGTDTKRVNRFPPNTLKCCPASVTAGEGGVVRCCSCAAWYHFACLEIHDAALKNHLSLAGTKWYCPEPACCERVLQEKLRRKR